MQYFFIVLYLLCFQNCEEIFNKFKKFNKVKSYIFYKHDKKNVSALIK